MKSTFKLLVVAAALLFLAGCKKDDDHVDDPHEHNEEETITTVILTFTEGTNIKTITFRDLDGAGGNTPTIDDIELSADTEYVCTISLLNESGTTPEIITTEVKEEGDEHLFCFDPTGVTLTTTRTDSDGTYGIGLESKWVTGAAGEGKVKVTLLHQPGIKDGTCDVGETDVEIDFNIAIK